MAREISTENKSTTPNARKEWINRKFKTGNATENITNKQYQKKNA